MNNQLRELRSLLDSVRQDVTDSYKHISDLEAELKRVLASIVQSDACSPPLYSLGQVSAAIELAMCGTQLSHFGPSVAKKAARYLSDDIAKRPARPFMFHGAEIKTCSCVPPGEIWNCCPHHPIPTI